MHVTVSNLGYVNEGLGKEGIKLHCKINFPYYELHGTVIKPEFHEASKAMFGKLNAVFAYKPHSPEWTAECKVQGFLPYA